MLRAWLTYALALACGFAFYVFSPGYFSFFLLVVLVLLPLLSLLFTLPGCLGLSLEVRVDRHALTRGEPATVRILPRKKFGTGYGLVLTWRVEDRLFPQLAATGHTLEFPLPTDHCGWVSCTVTRCALRDWMGLFRLPVRRPDPVLVLVRPVPDPVGLPKLDRGSAGAPLAPRPGGGPGEEYELRDYRPGDPVSAIHWKLTAKRPEENDPVLRETMEPAREALAVAYDHFGDPDRVDRSLDRLEALARQLLDRELPFTLCHSDPATGALTWFDVACPADWERCLRKLSARPAPPEGTGVPDPALPGHTGPVRWLRISGDEEVAG